MKREGYKLVILVVARAMAIAMAIAIAILIVNTLTGCQSGVDTVTDSLGFTHIKKAQDDNRELYAQECREFRIEHHMPPLPPGGCYRED